MYTSEQVKVGNVEILRISKEGGSAIEVVPSAGGLIYQTYLGNSSVPIFNPFSGESDILENSAFKQSILFPFPNRLKDASYQYENTAYHFPLNEPDNKNALHGFVYDQEFVLTELELSESSGVAELSYIYHGQNEAYPFPFTLRIRYSISDEYFELTGIVENTGYSRLPYGFGWHPYFKTDSLAKLKAPSAKIQTVNDRMLPTGEESFFDFGTEVRELSEKLDNAFRLSESNGFEITLGHFAGQMINIQADNSFKFFQIYNPETNVIAVEPVTCNINALNTGDELIFLEKGESKEHTVRISLEDES